MRLIIATHNVLSLSQYENDGAEPAVLAVAPVQLPDVVPQLSIDAGGGYRDQNVEGIARLEVGYE